MPIKYQHKETTDNGAKQIVAKMLEHKVALLNVDTGGGKTFMAIRAIGVFKHHAHIVVLTTKKQVDSKDWENSIKSYDHEVKEAHLTYGVFNYESLNHKKGQRALIKNLNTHLNQPLFVIIDEAHRIKNPTSNNFKHAKSFQRLKNFNRMIFLTATPVSESLLDCASYLILAGYYKNKTDFYKQHVTRYDKYFKPVIKDWNNKIHNEWLKDHEKIIQELNNIQIKIDTNALLPTVKYEEMDFKFSPKIQKGYRKIANDYRKGVYESIAAANADQRSYLAQHSTKRNHALSKIIDNPKRPQGPILIFYQYYSELDALKKYLPTHHKDYQIFEINGANHYDMNKLPPVKSIFLCQYMAAGEALNASWSHVSVFYAPTYSWERYKQARGRNTRAYQGGTTYHIRFVVLDTINEHYWYDLIDNKKQFTENLAKKFIEDDQDE